MKTVIFVIVFLSLCFGDERQYILNAAHRKLKVCDNAIVRNIPGSFEAVLEAGKQYVQSMHNNTMLPITEFTGAWKWEAFRVLGPQVPQCTNLHIFGDERRNYHEAKRFCYFPENKCVAYSIGSNDKWEFEEILYKESKCTIETFDCTVNATIPPSIRDRTKFYSACLSDESYKNGVQSYLTLPELNELVGSKVGPDYFKMDIEGYEWSVLKGLVRQADNEPELENQLPLQIYAQYHLDKDAVDKQSVQHTSATAHVGKKLRHFFDELFIKGGYMVMHVRNALQTSNTDVLLTKVFCQLSDDFKSME